MLDSAPSNWRMAGSRVSPVWVFPRCHEYQLRCPDDSVMAPEHAQRAASRLTCAITVREDDPDCAGRTTAAAASAWPQGGLVRGARQRKRVGMTMVHGEFLPV
jgi:hypothetical protein